MASNQFLILAIAAILLPTVAFATQYIVGDDSGWTVNFDYQAWAKDKVFLVGDQIVFKYNAKKHNVFKVNGTAFQDCIVPPMNEALDTGNDVITLATPGNKWYICGKPTHCSDLNQKLAITVVSLDVLVPAPASPPTTPAYASPPATPAEASPPTTPAPSAPYAAHGMAKKIQIWLGWNL